MTIEADLHVIFSPSGAGSLKQTLREAGREGRVLCSFDDFSFGPIASDDTEARSRWVDDVLGYTDWHEAMEFNTSVLKESLASPKPPIVWVSFNHAASYAGFLWWLWHMGETPCSVIERKSLSTLPARDLIGLFDQEVPLPAQEREQYQNAWKQLRIEDSALRMIEDGMLVSKEINAFDAALLKFATPQWQKAARIVAELFAEFWDAGLYQTGDLVLFSRIIEMADAGILEMRGDEPRRALREVRLPIQA